MATRRTTVPGPQDQKRPVLARDKVYQTPKLVRYGSVEQLTQGALSQAGDDLPQRRNSA